MRASVQGRAEGCTAGRLAAGSNGEVSKSSFESHVQRAREDRSVGTVE
jgi:hypothetical protein